MNDSSFPARSGRCRRLSLLRGRICPRDDVEANMVFVQFRAWLQLRGHKWPVSMSLDTAKIGLARGRNFWHVHACSLHGSHAGVNAACRWGAG